jgi:hypothetical protein
MRLNLFLFILTLSIPANALKRNGFSTTPTSREEGDTTIQFSSACPTGSWILVVSSGTSRRSAYLEASNFNAGTVCLSTAPIGTTCSSSTPGSDLAAGQSITDYGHSAWYCMGATAGNLVKGAVSCDGLDPGGLTCQ